MVADLEFGNRVLNILEMREADDIPSDNSDLSRQAEAERVNFLVKYARFQALRAENAELNLEKREIRKWGSKRQLAPPAIKKAAKAKRQESSGAPLKNRNRFKHGSYSAETLAFWATVTAAVKSNYALADEALARFPASKRAAPRPRTAQTRSV